MIDICTIIHKNYALLDCQLNHWQSITGDYRLLFADNTPREMRKTIPYDINLVVVECEGEDGETHGGTLDILVRQATSSIIGILDSDFFWLKPNILEEVLGHFEKGCRCVGVEHFYDDYAIVNRLYPDRTSYLAPSVFGMFIDRDLALSETFVATREEGAKFFAEGGWRIRKKIIDEQIPCHVYRAFRYPEHPDPQVYYFGTPDDPVGVHLLKGSIFRQGSMMESYQTALQVASKH